MLTVNKTDKNLKDSEDDLGIVIKDMSSTISYKKTNKLITALYMVTDILDSDEPLRNKLRTLGTDVISDIHFAPLDASFKIAEILSFLDIASAINIISEMNCNILRKEFSELNRAIEESTGKIEIFNKQLDLSGFFKEKLPDPKQHKNLPEQSKFSSRFSIGHQNPTRIGVQKGSTLMQALSDRNLVLSMNNSILSDNNDKSIENNFLFLKKERGEEMLNIIKSIGGNATIKDIKDKIKTMSENFPLLASCGEKTLQRELVSMVKDNVLYKTGEKRWSRYFIKN